MICGITASIITAHSLGPKGRGELIYISVFCLTVSNFSNLGFPSSNTFYLTANKQLLPSILSNSIYISIAGGVLGAIIAFFNFTGSIQAVLMKCFFVFLYVLFIMSSMFFSNILVSLDLIRKFNILEISQNLSILFLYILCALFKMPVEFFLLSTLFGTFIGTSYGFFQLNNQSQFLKKFDKLLFIKSISYATKVFLTTFIAYLIGKGNILLLQRHRTVDEIGVFSIGLQLYETIGVIPSAVGILLFPQFIKNNPNERFASMVSVLKQVSILMMIICAISFFALPYIIPFFFGEKFRQSIIIAQYFLPAAFFFGLMSVVSQFLAACGYPKMQVLIWLLIFLSWIFLSNIFIPSQGGVGVALIISFINFLAFFSLFLLSIKLRYAE